MGSGTHDKYSKMTLGDRILFINTSRDDPFIILPLV
jgi:hypothetical protein